MNKGKEIEMKEEKRLDTETRDLIFQFILDYPGVHFSKISRELNIPKSTLNYHLNFLKKKELITGIDEERYMRFFITKKIGKEDKKLLNIFRKNTQRKIILHLLKNSAASQKEISIKLNKAPSTIYEHLKKLLKHDILEVAKKKEKNTIYTNYEKKKTIKKTTKGREKYYILKDPYQIYKFLQENEKKLLNNQEIQKVLSFEQF